MKKIISLGLLLCLCVQASLPAWATEEVLPVDPLSQVQEPAAEPEPAGAPEVTPESTPEITAEPEEDTGAPEATPEGSPEPVEGSEEPTREPEEPQEALETQEAGDPDPVPAPALFFLFDEEEEEVVYLDVAQRYTHEISLTPPQGLSDPVLVWESSDEQIARVEEDGEILALAPGEVVISVRVEQAPELLAELSVVVRVPEEPAPQDPEAPESGDSIGFVLPEGAEEITLRVGETYTPELLLPGDLSEEELLFESSDEQIAQVDGEGEILALAPGEVQVSVQAQDAPLSAASPLWIIIIDEEEEDEGNPKITFLLETWEKTGVYLLVGDTYTPSLDLVLPEELEQGTLVWQNVNDQVATVGADGEISALSLGQTMVKVSLQEATEVSALLLVYVVEELPLGYGPAPLALVSGTFGQLTWSLDTDTFHLTISGTGGMPNYTDTALPPWGSYGPLIQKVTIMDGVTSIGNAAFLNHVSLREVTIPESVTVLGQQAFQRCITLPNITLPSGIRTIPAFCFAACLQLQNVTIPTGVQRIGSYAFAACQTLTEARIPDAVQIIEPDAYAMCTNLSSVILSKNLRSMDAAFVGCEKITSIELPATLTSMEGALAMTGITSIVVPEGVTNIDSAFFDCTALQSVQLPSTLRQIQKGTFNGCTSLVSIQIPEGVTRLSTDGTGFEEDGVFGGCTSLRSVTLPSTLQVIGYRTFEGCTNLTAITLPAGITTLGRQAFSNCTSLANVNIPATVTSIGDGAFQGCAGLQSATFAGIAPATFGSGVFEGAGAAFIIYYYALENNGFTTPTWNGYPCQPLQGVRQGVEGFLERLYWNVLGRAPDEYWSTWITGLQNGQETGASACNGFFMGAEFALHNVSDEEFVRLLYTTCMDRPPTAAELAHWTGAIDQGLSRSAVLNAFIKSDEYGYICEIYLINRGALTLDYQDQNADITMFINRLYLLMLNRPPELAGQNHWAKLLLTGQVTGKEMAYSFAFSDEFTMATFSDREFLQIMYRAMLGREADEAGLASWEEEIRLRGRGNIFNGFADSVEFGLIMTNYGVK